MSVIDRMRLAERQLEQRAPLTALETLEPIREELAGVVAGELLFARAYFASAQLNRAEQSFRRVLDAEPTEDYAHFCLGRTLERQGRLGEATPHYRMALALNPRPEYRDWVDQIDRAEGPGRGEK
jgi:Flp pilus assembly protein TadD